MVGRARPDENRGPGFFKANGTNGANSSFPSDTVGAAFALVTPFAQQFDAPWLYGVAATTAFDRLQTRRHFLSDTVAGGLFGYGVATLVNDNRRKRRNAASVSVGPDRRVMVEWDFQIFSTAQRTECAAYWSRVPLFTELPAPTFVSNNLQLIERRLVTATVKQRISLGLKGKGRARLNGRRPRGKDIELRQ